MKNNAAKKLTNDIKLFFQYHTITLGNEVRSINLVYLWKVFFSLRNSSARDINVQQTEPKKSSNKISSCLFSQDITRTSFA